MNCTFSPIAFGSASRLVAEVGFTPNAVNFALLAIEDAGFAVAAAMGTRVHVDFIAHSRLA